MEMVPTRYPAWSIMIRSRFGTLRGLVRLILSYPQYGLGLSQIRAVDPARVRRLVFLCQGNICRSAFADVAARRAGLNVASYGLSTDDGRAAHGPAIDAARMMGHDLSAHRARDIGGYAPMEGDLILAMEVRQLHRLAADPRLAPVPRTLLGLWAQPAMPHLHDPYGLDDRYMAHCLQRIERALEGLVTAFPGAMLSSPSASDRAVRGEGPTG